MVRVYTAFLALFAILATDPPATATPPAGIDWVETFTGEFKGSTLESNLWTVGHANRLDALIDSDERGILLSDGILHLVTRHHEDGIREWTSATITPRHFRQTYGYLEARIRFARATGLDDVLLLGTDNALAGERVSIDILDGRYPNLVTFRLQQPGGRLESRNFFTAMTDFSAGYHLFALSWLPNPSNGSTHLVWYIDDRPLFQADCNHCDQPMRLWLGTRLTTWAGPFAPVADGTSMDVDYVRVYQAKPLLTDHH